MLHKSVLRFCLFVVVGCCAACRGTPTATPTAVPTETSPAPTATAGVFSFPIYTEQGGSGSTFVPSGWMGHTDGISLDESWTKDPYEGERCIHIVCKPQSDGDGWAGVYWLPYRLNPRQDWGSQVNGVDLTGASRLTFWARGAVGGERVEFFAGGVEGPQGDSMTKKALHAELTTEWRQYSINLNGADLSRVVGAFGWAASEQVEFWLDEIKFE